VSVVVVVEVVVLLLLLLLLPPHLDDGLKEILLRDLVLARRNLRQRKKTD
jgi:hypothetical protein